MRVSFPLRALVLLLFAACAPPVETTDTSAPVERVIPVAVQEAVGGTVDEPVEITGSVGAARQVVVASEAAGRVLSVTAALGDRVDEGAILARVDATVAKAQVAQARAQLASAQAMEALARSGFEQAEMLLADGAVTPSSHRDAQLNFQAATAQAEAADAALSMARRALANTTLRAPFAGTIAGAHLEVGALIGAGTPAFQLVEVRRVVVSGGVAAADIGRVHAGQLARVDRTGAGPTILGEVRGVGPSADPRTRSWPVEIELPNPDGALRPGMVARVAILVGSRDDAVLIPEDAVVDADPPVVFVIEGEVAHQRPVVLGRSVSDGVVEARSGVAVGDRVVTYGRQHLSEGARVSIAELPAAPPAP